MAHARRSTAVTSALENRKHAPTASMRDRLMCRLEVHQPSNLRPLNKNKPSRAFFTHALVRVRFPIALLTDRAVGHALPPQSLKRHALG